MTSNMGDGFLGWQARIARITEALGGSEQVAEWVGGDFADVLQFAMADTRGCSRHDLPWRIFWAQATTAEFDMAGRNAELTMGIEQSYPIETAASWRGATIARRATVIWVEGGGFRLLAAMASRDDHASARSGKERWSAHISDRGVEAAGRSFGPGRHKSANAGSRDTAIRAAERIVEQFFGVKLAKVTNAK